MAFGSYKDIPLADLIPYERNARTHSDLQVSQLARSINEFGFTNPVLVDEQNRVIAGHGRMLAATKLGMPVVPCMVIAGLTDVQRRALILADNKLAMNAGWDVDLLSSELGSLKLEGFDLDMTGFSIEELGALFEEKQGGDPDTAPPLPADPVCQPGDVWQLGPHRVMCGSATSMADMHKLAAGERVDCVWTDPPYNVAYAADGHKAIANDDMEDEAFRLFLFDAFTVMVDVMKPGAPIYVAHPPGPDGRHFFNSFMAAGFKLSGVIIWHKDSLVLGRSDYQWQHEPILYGWKKGSAHKWFGGRKNTSVQSLGEHSPFVQMADGRWQVTLGNQTMIVEGDANVEEVIPSVIDEAKPKRNDIHPTMKPVALIERMLKHSARPKDIILDPFGGSGSTLIAAERLGMCARLMELDPGYVDVIIGRWEQFTGRTAELIS